MEFIPKDTFIHKAKAALTLVVIQIKMVLVLAKQSDLVNAIHIGFDILFLSILP